MNEKLKFGFLTLGIICFQSVLKIYGVLITGSLTFLAETVDTLVDFVFVSILIYSLYHSQKPPDYEHMFGHSKIDPIGALIQGIILINLYILLILNALNTIMLRTYFVSNPLVGLQLLMVSFIVNLICSRILILQGKKRNSPSLRIQGLNLFQDSMRAIIVIISFIFALFGMPFMDPLFSIILSVYIIIGAVNLTKSGINELTDINPINSIILEDLRHHIFNLDHVNGVEDLRIRASGGKLFLEIRLSVEDHISIIHAHEIIKIIRSMGDKFFPNYNVEYLVEMNPLGGEKSIGENIINLIYSMKAEYPEIIKVKDLNIFRVEDKYFLSFTMIFSAKLTLKEAHDICTLYENELKASSKDISRIITHIESASLLKEKTVKSQTFKPIQSEQLDEVKRKLTEVLETYPQIKGYHGFEFWTSLDYNILEVHVFFEGSLNIAYVHELTSVLEQEIQKLDIEGLKEVIIHAEPYKGRTDGIYFESKK